MKLVVFTALVVPAPVNSLKFTGLVQSMAFSLELEARHEFNGSSIVLETSQVGGLDAQAQPALRRVKANPGWSALRMPGITQVVFIAFYESAVTGAHKLLCGRGIILASNESATTLIESFPVAAMAGPGVCLLHAS